MESIFKNNKAKQSSLNIKKVETPQALADINQSENLVFQQEAQDDVEMQEEPPQLQFEITSCYKLATKPEVKLSTGCKIIDDFLRGGILTKRIYEVYGESGTGKTQLAI